MKQRQVRFYFAFRSPYSWLGACLLEQRFSYADYRQEIAYIPFWEPDAESLALLQDLGGKYLYAPMNKAKHLYTLLDTKRLSAKYGYQMVWPIDQDPWWDLPHLAYLKARRLGKGYEFFWAVYQARWQRGENICTREIIGRLACEVGLKAEDLIAAPEDEEIRLEGAAALHQAYQDDIFGIPYFKYGHERFWGVDRFEEFAARFAQSSDNKKGNKNGR